MSTTDDGALDRCGCSQQCRQGRDCDCAEPVITLAEVFDTLFYLGVLFGVVAVVGMAAGFIYFRWVI